MQKLLSNNTVVELKYNEFWQEYQLYIDGSLMGRNADKSIMLEVYNNC